MKKHILGLLILLAFGLFLTPVEAAIQLNINTTAQTFWFSGSDTGTPWQGIAPNSYFTWKTPVLQANLHSFDVTTAFSTPGTVSNAGLTVWNTGLHFGLSVQDSYESPTTVTAHPEVVFSYADTDADTIASIAMSLSYPLVLAVESGSDTSDITLHASNSVPEPSAWILVALGALVLGVVASRRGTFSSP